MPAVAKRNMDVDECKDGGISSTACNINGFRYAPTATGFEASEDSPSAYSRHRRGIGSK